jgi:DNA modification methylase
MMDEIILGNAYDLIRKVPDRSVDLIVTDPPYQLNNHGGGRGILKGRKGGFIPEISTDLMSKGIHLEILDEFIRIEKKTNIYIFASKNQIYDYLTFFCEKHNCSFDLLIWAKANTPPFCSKHYLPDKEYCLFFAEKGATFNGKNERCHTFFFDDKNLKDKELYHHPTIKPEAIISDFIANSSNAGDVVLDPFSGSGTTAVVAKKMGRHYLGFEIDPRYYKTSIERLNGDTCEDTQRKEEGQLTLF